MVTKPYVLTRVGRFRLDKEMFPRHTPFQGQGRKTLSLRHGPVLRESSPPAGEKDIRRQPLPVELHRPVRYTQVVTAQDKDHIGRDRDLMQLMIIPQDLRQTEILRTGKG